MVTATGVLENACVVAERCAGHLRGSEVALAREATWSPNTAANAGSGAEDCVECCMCRCVMAAVCCMQAQHLRVIQAVRALKDDMLVLGTSVSAPATSMAAAMNGSGDESVHVSGFDDVVVGPKLQEHLAALSGWFEESANGEGRARAMWCLQLTYSYVAECKLDGALATAVAQQTWPALLHAGLCL